MIKSKQLQDLDFGAAENLQRYGHVDAHIYDTDKVKNCTVPIVFVTTKGDRTVIPASSKHLSDRLGNQITKRIEIEGGHVTFGVGKDDTWFRE